MKQKDTAPHHHQRSGLMWVCAVLMVCSNALGLRAQDFGTFNPPQRACAATTTTLRFGFSSRSDVSISLPRTSLNRAAVAFLPDGIPCSPYGCSYRSPLTFTDFAPESVVRSVEDIQYVRVNIEHSFMADIYINLTCPNGQKANLMRFGGNATSNCQDAIPESARGWLDGDNVSGSTFLGQAHDDENSSEPCNANAKDNQPGTGWNYCWSNNTTSGYSYASGDGIIYRRGHSSGGRIDSSHVAAHRNFYHPDQNFSALAGCPLNGTWYIEVVDGYRYDNGYIFDWELSLAPDLLPTTCTYASHTIESDWVNRINDTTFQLTVPSTLSHDTVVGLRFLIVNTCGDTIERWQQLNVSLPKHITLRDTAVENNLPIRPFRGVTLWGDADTTMVLRGRNGCDSVVDYSLKVWRNVEQRFDTVECGEFSPQQWRGVSFSNPCDTVLRLSTTHRADSIVHLSLRTAPVYDLSVDTAICKGDIYYLGEQPLRERGSYMAHLESIDGCDSLVGLELMVHPSYADTVADTVCRAVGVDFEGVHYDRRGIHTHRLLTTQGCDSLRSLALIVYGENLKAIAGIDPPIASLEEPVVSFTNRSREAEHVWWQVDGEEYGEQHFSLKFPEHRDSIKVVLVAIDSNGCTDTFRTSVWIDRSSFYAPNIFTPTLETNNRWAPAMNDITDIEIWIYDRQGVLVYHHEGTDSEWDGTHNGQVCTQGCYVYTAEYRRKLYPNKPYRSVGTITLIR